MRTLGKNIVYYLKCVETGKENWIHLTVAEKLVKDDRLWTIIFVKLLP